MKLLVLGEDASKKVVQNERQSQIYSESIKSKIF